MAVKRDDKGAMAMAGIQRIQPQVQQLVSEAVGERNAQFFLFVWWGLNGVSFVTTNPDKAHAIATLRETIDNWEGGAMQTVSTRPQTNQ